MKRRELLYPVWMPALMFAAALAALATGCRAADSLASEARDGRIRVVATTTFIGDVVMNIAGDAVNLTVLLEPGQNPHSYQPAPMDMVAVTEADLILVNGFGLEDFLDDLLEGSGTDAAVRAVSEGIKPVLMEVGLDDPDHDDPMEGEMGLDPHVWFDPGSLLTWVDNITAALEEIDPAHQELYQRNADAYRAELKELDGWILEQVSVLPEQNRRLVTGHLSLGYFARRYGMAEVGAVIPALTTEAETSGMELAALIEIIREYRAGAVFVGADLDQTLAQRVAEEAGVPLVPLYFGSLTAGEPAGTYLDFMRYNVRAIVDALR